MRVYFTAQKTTDLAGERITVVEQLCETIDQARECAHNTTKYYGYGFTRASDGSIAIERTYLTS